MFRTVRRLFLPNPLDAQLKRCAKRGGKKILLGWNRGLGDIALGLFAIIERIREKIPGAEISFLTRSNLKDGFSLLPGIHVLIDPDLRRGACWEVPISLRKIGMDPKSFDLVIPRPNPTEWVAWQRGKVTPRLEWDGAHEDLWKNFDLPDGFMYIGVQVVVETSYGPWRNWPLKYYEQLFSRLEKFPDVKVILFGSDEKTEFSHKNLIDLRGKTTLFELLSIVRHRCSQMVLPDSGILSMVYYLNVQFPLHVISLWGDPNHGILKQAVASPNLLLRHTPMVGALRDLSTVTVDQMMNALFPVKPLLSCATVAKAPLGSLEHVGCIILAGGQGSRLNMQGPKGAFAIFGKSLFERLCAKAPKENFPIAIMTSPLNHAETVSFFAKHGNFGREVYFFEQEMHPFLDLKKRPLKSVQTPNGNGSVFSSFVKSGLAEVFAKKGIDLVTIVPIENALADPADRSLIGFMRLKGSDATIKCVERESSSESMGAIVEREGRIEVLEYIDCDPNVSYMYSNTGMMAMKLSFICQMANVDLPIHWVKKSIPGTKKWGWKGEKFIFDCFPFGEVSALCYPKQDCYAPLKSIEALSSIEDSLSNMLKK